MHVTIARQKPTPFVQQGGVQQVGQGADLTEHCSASSRLSARNWRAWGLRAAAASLRNIARGGEVLAGTIVQFAGDSASLLVLQAEQLAG
jgi:hypothetical protein